MSDRPKVAVKPINIRTVDGQTYEDQYTFKQVHTEDIPDDYTQKNVDIEVGRSAVRWEYMGKCPILIKRNKVLMNNGDNREEGQNQAYFALSILADDGYVSGFKQL